jgi:hypothetical protein
MATIHQVFKRTNYNLVSRLVRRGKKPITKDQVRILEEGLDQLPAILGEKEWFLTGGVALQIAYGKWFRNPGNINISVPEESLYEVTQHACERGSYGLLSRGVQVRTAFSRKWEGYEVVEWNEQGRLRRNYANLRLVRFEEAKPVNNQGLLDFIDVHPYRVVQYRYGLSPHLNLDWMESFNGDKEVLNVNTEILKSDGEYRTISGKIIKVRGVDYLRRLKNWLIEQEPKERRRKNGLHAYDLSKLIERYDSAQMSADCKEAVMK